MMFKPKCDTKCAEVENVFWGTALLFAGSCLPVVKEIKKLGIRNYNDFIKEIN